MKHSLWFFSIFSAALLFLGACGPGETIVDDGGDSDRVETDTPGLDDDGLEFAELDLDRMDDEELMLFEHRSRLQDQFATLTHDTPDIFFREIEEADVDLYLGFRIQILSTRNVELADTTRAEFDEWAANHLAGYVPRSYVHYRQPFYRVRIGDFHNRNRAIEMSRLVQQRFPDAWIVHDRVQPYRVPSDTTEFRIGEPSELSPEVFDDIEMIMEMDEELAPPQEEINRSDEEIPEQQDTSGPTTH